MNRFAAGAAALPAALLAADLHARAPTTPWVDEREVAPPAWARSAAPRAGAGGEPGDLVLFAGPSRAAGRRGVTAPGAALPFYGSRRGPGCSGVWWLLGPVAWTCSDDAELSGDAPSAPVRVVGADGLFAQYFFARGDGASAYASLDAAEQGAADRDLEGGWAVAVVEQRAAPSGAAGQERFARTTKGFWIAMRDLLPARPSTFHGQAIADGALDLAWVASDRASEWAEANAKAKPTGSRARFESVRIREEAGTMVHLASGTWMLSRDLARPSLAPPPTEAGRPGQRWIDVDLASQTLVAYEGSRPLYATLVSSGRPGSATPPGIHRIWVKLVATDMDNVERGDLEAHYSMEDVPYTQFFDGGVALHGTYWHGDFGRVHSHGCVNLAPLDARWLFDFTGPRLPDGWVAAYPTPSDPGTVVRVR